MNLKDLYFFRKIVDAKSISKVSQGSFISQSALSQMIQRLESEMGFKLLERSNKGVSLTEMGEVVYKHAETMLRLSDEMKNELCLLSECIKNIKISGYYSFVNYSLPCVLYKVKKEFEDLNFESSAKPSEQVIMDLSNQLVDIGFINIEPQDSPLKYAPIGKEKVVLVASNNIEGIPDVISVDDIVDYELIYLNSGSVRKEFINSKLQDVELKYSDLNVVFEVDNIAAAKSSVQNGLGLCFLPYMSVKQELYYEDFKIVEIEDFDFNYMIYVAMIEKCNPSNTVKRVFEYFVKNGPKDIC